MTFASLGLSDSLLRAIAEQGYDTPSPVQAKAIPLARFEVDLNRDRARSRGPGPLPSLCCSSGAATAPRFGDRRHAFAHYLVFQCTGSVK